MTSAAAVLLLLLTLGQNAPEPHDLWPHSERFVQANGARLHCLEWGGAGEPLILLTGYGAEAHTFDSFAPRFTDRFRVLAFTRRGRSPSERTPSGYDLNTLTADLEAFMDAMGLGRVHLVGHSFAGTEMTQFATRHPDRVISLVYLDAALDLAAAEAVMRGGPISLPQPSPGSPYAQVLEWSTSYSPDFTRLRSPALAFFALQDESPATEQAADEGLRHQIDEYWRTKWIPMVRNTVDKFEKEIPNGRVVVLRNASHYLFQDREDEVVREMERFYRSLN